MASSALASRSMGRVCTPLRAAPCQQQRGASVVTHAKKGLHPEYFSTAKVVCNGQEVMVVGGTKSSYNVDIYSGNHPFYQVCADQPRASKLAWHVTACMWLCTCKL